MYVYIYMYIYDLHIVINCSITITDTHANTMPSCHHAIPRDFKDTVLSIVSGYTLFLECVVYCV